MALMLARIEASPSTRRELVQALLQYTAATRRSAQAAAFLYEDLENPHVLCVVTDWSTAEALELHVAGPAFGNLVGAAELLASSGIVTIAARPDAGALLGDLRRRARAAQQDRA